MIGRRPKRSDNAPSTGAKKNCMAAHTVPKRNNADAVRLSSPPMKSTMSRGSTGTMIPRARTSSMTVMKMKTSAAERRPGTAGVRGSFIMAKCDD